MCVFFSWNDVKNKWHHEMYFVTTIGEKQNFYLPRSWGALRVPPGVRLTADVWDVWPPLVVIPMGTPCPQPLHQGSESDVQRPHAAPLSGTGRSVVRVSCHRWAQVTHCPFKSRFISWQRLNNTTDNLEKCQIFKQHSYNLMYILILQ